MSKTNSPGKDMSYISTSLNKEILAMIDKRSKQIGLTRSGYLRNILTQWYEKGCPPISKVDELMVQSEGNKYYVQTEDKLSLKVAEADE